MGGAERVTNTLAIRLREVGIDARVVYVGDPFPGCRELEAGRVPFIAFGAKRGRDVLRAPRRFAALVSDAGPDGAILQSDGFLPAVLRLGGYVGPLVAVEHGDVLAPQGLLRRGGRLSGNWALDAQVAVSDYMRDRLLARRKACRVERIHHGIDLSRFRPTTDVGPERPFTVGFVGRLVPGKGVEDLLAALAVMHNRSAQLIIAGDGSERTNLERLAIELGLAQRVHFLGMQDDVCPVWQAADVGAVPSAAPEGAGLVALEAAGCGKPVVASGAGGLSELVQHGVTGFVVAPGDVAAIARALDLYADDPTLRKRHGAAGRHRCESEFDIGRSAREYAELLSSLADADR